MAEKKLFIGCVIANRIPYLESTTRKVFDKVGLKVSDAPFSCCPDPVGFHSVDHETWLTMGARNISLAEAEGKEIVSLCNGCYQTLANVNHELKENPQALKRINKVLSKINRQFKGTSHVKHFVHALIEDVGIEKIAEKIVNPLRDLRVACHAGCHYSRPSEILHSDDPFAPTFPRSLVALTGASVVNYEEEKLCCGAGASNLEKDVGLALAKQKMESAKKAGANCMVVICPACFQQLDSLKDLPIIYLTELLALSMGETFESLSMKYHLAKGKAFCNMVESRELLLQGL